MPEAFTDYKGVTKSSYRTRNAPEKSGGTNKPFNSHFQRRGGEVQPLLRTMLQVSIRGNRGLNPLNQ